MSRHKNLYADLSWGLSFVAGSMSTSLSGSSKRLLERHADRFMTGFDFQSYNPDWGVANAVKIIGRY